MKYIFLLLITLLLISGCSHIDAAGGEATDIDDEPEVIYGEPEKDSDDTYVGDDSKVYILKKGEKVTVDGTLIKVKDFTQNEKLILEIGDQVRQIEETKKEVIVNGLVITPDKFDFNSGEITLLVEPLVLKLNEYFVKQGESVKVGSRTFTLTNILTDDLRHIEVQVFAYETQYAARIKESDSKLVGGLKVTNVKSNPRGITLEKYSIVRLEIE